MSDTRGKPRTDQRHQIHIEWKPEWDHTTFSRSLNLRFSRDVGSNMILSAFSSGEDNQCVLRVDVCPRGKHGSIDGILPLLTEITHWVPPNFPRKDSSFFIFADCVVALVFPDIFRRDDASVACTRTA
ncbi:hypothetical protein EYF80_013750 [Liparis tanakae]|uniref:Uncharacterized protein n=1 Tax=Liparis tanakae TaxID=230148 RepID=A0A4Z2IDK4_9TELE|nr:hypothetical protein EYF80_013750 [Liparis tanakae]